MVLLQVWWEKIKDTNYKVLFNVIADDIAQTAKYFMHVNQA